MPDTIRTVQRFIRRLTGKRDLFAFARQVYGQDGIEPSPLRNLQTRLGRTLGTRLFSHSYPGIPGRVHVHETMMLGDDPDGLAHYIRVGGNAMENIEAGLAAAGSGWRDIRSCLDMGCGFGRVLRHIARRIPPHAVTACDLEEEAVRFCAEELGARPLLSTDDLRDLHLPGTYDLIWVGSLFSHLPYADAMVLFDKLGNALTPGGVMCFTTQGASCLDHIAFYGPMFAPLEADYRAQVAGRGWHYAPYYPSMPRYGIMVYRRDALEDALAALFGPRLRLVRFAGRGWDNHQDSWAYQRAAESAP